MSRSYSSSSVPEEPEGPSGNGPVRQGTSGKAISSLVLGIAAVFLGLFCCGLGLVMGVPAIVVGRLARAEIAASGGLQSGMRLASTGIVLGIISCVMSIVLIVLTLSGVIETPRKP
jgi:hypothetical protein